MRFDPTYDHGTARHNTRTIPTIAAGLDWLPSPDNRTSLIRRLSSYEDEREDTRDSLYSPARRGRKKLTLTQKIALAEQGKSLFEQSVSSTEGRDGTSDSESSGESSHRSQHLSGNRQSSMPFIERDPFLYSSVLRPQSVTRFL